MKNVYRFFAIGAFTLLSSQVSAQKIIGVFESDPEIRVVFLGDDTKTHISMSLDNFQSIQRPAQSNSFQILNHPKILESLDLSNEQKMLLKEIQERVAAKKVNLAANYKKLLSEESSIQDRVKIANDYLRELTEFEDLIAKEIDEDLIPHQSNLLERQKFQQSVRLFGFSRAITLKPFDEELKIKASQRKEITEFENAANAEIRKQVAKIKKELEQRIRRLLDREQKSRLRRLEEPLD